jgi:hypothetical protein
MVLYRITPQSGIDHDLVSVVKILLKAFFLFIVWRHELGTVNVRWALCDVTNSVRWARSYGYTPEERHIHVKKDFIQSILTILKLELAVCMSPRACFSGNNKYIFVTMEYTSSCHSRIIMYIIKGNIVFVSFILLIGNADLVASDGCWIVNWKQFGKKFSWGNQGAVLQFDCTDWEKTMNTPQSGPKFERGVWQTPV